MPFQGFRNMNWNEIQKPIIGLSPMADMTDSSFCRVVKSIANPIIFREMISAEAVVRGNKKTLAMAKIDDSERPLIQQIFGSDPMVMANAAKIIEDQFHPDGIDLNMGCPAKKIVSNFNGSALMKNPELAAEIVKAVKSAVSVPVSVKMRAGWSDPEACIEFARKMEEAGADLITVHGRTASQGYSGKARRDVVATVKKHAHIPVLYNGDIETAEDFVQALKETGCDGALIGRGALGNPWIFKQIEDMLAGHPPHQPTAPERFDILEKHLALHMAQYGEQSTPWFRKHLIQYLKGLPSAKSWRISLMQAETPQDILKILATYSQNLDQTIENV